MEEPGVIRVCPKNGDSIFREDTSELDDKVQNLSQENVQNILNETLDLSNVNAQGSDEELDLDNDGWDLSMNTMPKYYSSAGPQKLRIVTKFFVQLRKSFISPTLFQMIFESKLLLKG